MISPRMKTRRSAKDLARRVGEIDGAFDAVAKAELLREPHGHAFRAEGAARRPQLFHHLTAVMRFDLRLHRRHHVGRAEVDAFWRRGWGGRRQVQLMKRLPAVREKTRDEVM